MKRLLIAIATVLGVAIAPFSTPAANATVTQYHSYCQSTATCHEAEGGSLFVQASYYDTATNGSEIDQVEVYGEPISAKGTLLLDKLAIKAVDGTTYNQKVRAVGCTYTSPCYYTVYHGGVAHADLYGHYAFYIGRSLKYKTVKKGVTDYLSGGVTPAAGGQIIYLQRYYSGGWHSWKSVTINSKSHYRIAFRFPHVGKKTLRLYKPAHGTTGRRYTGKIIVTVTN